MVDESQPKAPIFLDRDGLLPAPGLLAELDRPGLARTVTVFGQDAWLVTRAEDVRTVYGDAVLFTTSDSVPIFRNDDPERADLPGALLFMDPPEHTEMRSMLTASFTTRALARLEPRITAIVDEHLDALVAKGSPADLVAAFSRPVPALVICELLGVPESTRNAFQRDVDKSFDFTLSEEERAAGNASINAYMGQLVDEAFRRPGEDMLGSLVQTYGDRLTRKGLVGIGATLLQAGHETTAEMIASSVLTLLTHPAQLTLFRNEPGVIRTAVEELLRYLAVVQISPPRRATRDTVVGGQHIAQGDLLLAALPAANHDPAAFDHPERLDLTRKASGHLAFGYGIHHCLGAPLARLELGIALPALFARLPHITLDSAPEAIDYKTSTVAHGIRSLPIAW